MEIASAESHACATFPRRRPARRQNAAGSCDSVAHVRSRAPYLKSVCEAASTPPRPPQRCPSLGNSSSSASVVLRWPFARHYALSAAPTGPVARPAPAKLPAVCTNSAPSPGTSYAYPASYLSSDWELVAALRLQVEQAVRRARDAEENERQLRLALREVEENQTVVLAALQDNRHSKVTEGNTTLQQRLCQLEAENASLRAEIDMKEADMGGKDREIEKLMQELFNTRRTLECVRKRQLVPFDHVKEKELSAANVRLRFPPIPGGEFLSTSIGMDKEVTETYDSFSAVLLESVRSQAKQEFQTSPQGGENGVRLAETAHVSSNENPPLTASCNRIGNCSLGHHVGNRLSGEATRATAGLRVASAPSPRPAEHIAQLQADNAVLKKVLWQATAAVDNSEILLRENEGDAGTLRTYEGHVEQLHIEGKESKQLLQQRDREIKQLQGILLQQELAKVSIEQVSAKLNARVTELLLELRQTESRCEEMEGVYKSKITRLEERLATYSPPVCVEAQAQTTHLFSSIFQLKELMELNAERFSLLALEMKERLVAFEQEKNDKLLEHERLAEEKELHLRELSAWFASDTEEHAAEKKKLHATLSELEGELTLCRTKQKTATNLLQKLRRRLCDSRITQQALAAEKQQETEAHLLVVSRLGLRLKAEKEKLKEALNSMYMIQKHLRRMLQPKKISATSTQTCQTEDRHSVVVEIPSEFQEPLDLLSAPLLSDTQQRPTAGAGGVQQKKDKSLRMEEKGDFSFRCTNRNCAHFAADASERICMLTAAVLCKTHAVTAAEERLTSLQQELVTKYSLHRQVLEERRGRLEARRRLLRAETEWRGRVSFLEKQNERLLQERKEAIGKVDLLRASETKLQRECLLLREEHSLCRKQLEALHHEYTTRASQERVEHEELLHTLKHSLRVHSARNHCLQPPILSSVELTHTSDEIAQTADRLAARGSRWLQNACTGSHILRAPHPRALERSAYSGGTDLVEDIRQLATFARSLHARLENLHADGVSAASPTTRCCSCPSARVCCCMVGTCVNDECTPGDTTSSCTKWRQSREEGGINHKATCSPSGINSCSPGREEALNGNKAANQSDLFTQQRLTDAEQCVEPPLRPVTLRVNGPRVTDVMGSADVQEPNLSCNRMGCSMKEGHEARYHGEGNHKCTRLGIVLPMVNSVDHQSVVSAEMKELLDQLCDLLLCAGQRLADAEQAKAINKVVTALTYKQWQLQKAREVELLRQRALLRHQLQVSDRQRLVKVQKAYHGAVSQLRGTMMKGEEGVNLSATQAASDRLESGLCELYRRRCEEIEKQQLVEVRQLRVDEEERKQLISSLRETEHQALALQGRLSWTEARKRELEVLTESTAEERSMQRLLSFKEEVLVSLQAESNLASLVPFSPPCGGETGAKKASGELLSQLSEQVAQERRERATIHFALKEMQHENKLMLLVLDQKEKQLALVQEMNLPRPHDVAPTVENAQERGGIQADRIVQKKVSPRATGGGTSPTTISSIATTSASFCQLDSESFHSYENDPHVIRAELLGTASQLKGVVHQQQVEMHKQAEKLSCCEIEAANLRLRNESLSSELSRHVSQLKETQAALEDTARFGARMEKVELWASRLGQAHQAELNRIHSAQSCRLQQISRAWKEKTNKVLKALRVENAALKTTTQKLCADTEALQQQLRRHKEALQRHSVLNELSQAGFGALHTFEQESTLKMVKSAAQKTVVAQQGAAFSQRLTQHRKSHGVSRGLSAVRGQSASREGARMNNTAHQPVKNAVPSTIVKCLLQAFTQLCIQLAECERQLLADVNPSTSASSKLSSMSRPPRMPPLPLHHQTPQHPSPDTSVLRGQRLVIQWLYTCTLNHPEDSFRALSLESPSAEMCHSANNDRAQKQPRSMCLTEKTVDAMLSSFPGVGQLSQLQSAARGLPQKQRRALLHLREGARDLFAVLKQTCQFFTTTSCAQQLIVKRLRGIERAVSWMRRTVGAKCKVKRKKYRSELGSDVRSTDSLHRWDQRESDRDSTYNSKRSDCEHRKCTADSSSDSEPNRLTSQQHGTFGAFRPGGALASERAVLDAEFGLSPRAFATALFDTEQVLHLVCNCAKGCSLILEKADLAAERLSAKLDAIYSNANKVRDRPSWQPAGREETRKQDKGILARRRRSPPRFCQSFSRSCSHNCRGVSKTRSLTRGRSLTTCNGRRPCLAKEELSRNKRGYTSTRRSSHSSPSHDSSTINSSDIRQSPRGITPCRGPTSSLGQRAYRRGTSGSGRSRFLATHSRSHSFPASRRGRMATSARKRMCCLRTFTGEFDPEGDQTETAGHSEASSRGCAVTTNLNKSRPSGIGALSFPSKGESPTDKGATTKPRKTHRRVKSDNYINCTHADGKTGEGRGCMRTGSSPLSRPPVNLSSMNATEMQHFTKIRLGRGLSRRLRPRHCIADDSSTSSYVSPSDSNLARREDYLPTHSLQSPSKKDTDINPRCNLDSACKSVCATAHGRSAHAGDRAGSYPPLSSPQQGNKYGAEGAEEQMETQALKECTSTLPDGRAVHTRRIVSKHRTPRKPPCAEVAGTTRPSSCFSANIDAALVPNAKTSSFGKNGVQGELSMPPSTWIAGAQPFSATKPQVVAFSPHLRQHHTRHGLPGQQAHNVVSPRKSVPPSAVVKQDNGVYRQGEHRSWERRPKPREFENTSAGTTQYGNGATAYEAQQAIQEGTHNRKATAKATTLCNGRPDWLPPRCGCQDFLPNNSTVHEPGNSSPLGGKRHPLAVSIDIPGNRQAIGTCLYRKEALQRPVHPSASSENM